MQWLPLSGKFVHKANVDDRVGAVPGPDSVNRRVTEPDTEPGSVPGLVRLKRAMCRRGLWLRHHVFVHAIIHGCTVPQPF